MPFRIVRNDITRMQVDAIVNTADPQPVIGMGTDSAIHQAAGAQLLLARQQVGVIPRGGAAVTPAFKLQAKYVIHTVGPVWEGGSHNEEQLLAGCYEESLRLAEEKDCRSIAFPLISTGCYGFPKDKALQIAIRVFSRYLADREMDIYLVVFDKTSFKLSERLFEKVASYIDDNYLLDQPPQRYSSRRLFKAAAREKMECAGAMPAPCAARLPQDREEPCCDAPEAMRLEEILEQADAGFTQTLLQLIDRQGKKDSEVYKKANLSKQHFSKIRNDPNYRPTKPTAIALALALELDLEATRDLIGRAGFALSNSSKFDLIIRYFIERGIYNIVQINMALYEFDQPLLGA